MRETQQAHLAELKLREHAELAPVLEKMEALEKVGLTLTALGAHRERSGPPTHAEAWEEEREEEWEEG